jgi:autotransporter-associated beta strand protein
MKTNIVLATAFVLFAVVSVKAVDGTYVYSDESSNWNSGSRWWQYGRSPSDGGVATFLAGNKNSPIKQTVSSGLRLGGITTPSAVTTTFNGSYPIIFTGSPFIFNGAGTYYFSGVPLEVESGATLDIEVGKNTASSSGAVDLSGTSFGGVGSVRLSGGTVRQSGTTSTTCVSENSVYIGGGDVEIAPAESGATVAETMSTASGASVVAAKRGGRLMMTQGGATSITLTMGALSREDRGTITIPANPAALGVSQFYRFTSVPAAVNGFMPAYLALLKPDRTYDLFAYDADDGLVPAAWASSLGTDGTSAVAIDVSGATNDDDAHVAALKLDLSTGSFVNNGRIQIGNGTDPAALVLNWNEQRTISGTGSFDFGSSEGMIWLGSKMSTVGLARELFITTPVHGSNGLTLTGRQNSCQPIFVFGSADNDFSGPLHVMNCRLYITRTSNIPPAVPIHIDGSCNSRSAQLYFFCTGVMTNDVYLSGYGLASDNDHPGAILVAGSGLHLAGNITLEGDTRFGLANNVTTYIDGPITGEGELSFGNNGYNNGNIWINGTNTWVGGLSTKNPLTISLGNPGATLGKGEVNLIDGSTLDVSSADGVVVSNVVTGSGVLKVGSNATFTASATFAKVTMSSGATLCASNLVVSSFPAPAATEVKGVFGGSSVTIGGDGAAETFRGTLGDGEGVLSLEKTGANTVTLHGPQSYSGSTTVSGGTLKLESQENPVEDGISWWIDADATNTMLFAADGVTVTNWASRVGTFAFGAAGTVPSDASNIPAWSHVYGSQWGCPKLEDCSWAPGHKVVRFYTNTFDRLYATDVGGTTLATHRTVFFVTRTVEYWYYKTGDVGGPFGGLFGRAGSDYGIRLTGYTPANDLGSWSGADNNSNFFDSDGKYWDNGELKNYQFTWSKPQILVAEQSLHADNSNMVTFRPAIGGYFNTHTANPFRPYGGEYAEVIAYNRVLTDAERQKVEDYLARKWYSKDFYGTAEQSAAVLPESTALEIKTGGVLDLNGVSATVASLSGIGTITNSGAAATLTVTGESTFAGVVGGDVTLSFKGGASGALKMEGDAALDVSGAASIAPYTPTPPKDGLLYWLDASHYDTFKFASDGVTVTNWASRIPGLASFEEPTGTTTEFPPVYDPSGMNGKPAVYFGKDNTETRLCANSSCATRTLFIVTRGAATAETAVDGLWGPYNTRNNDIGVRFRNGSNTSLQFRSGGMYFNFGDMVRVDGVVPGPTVQATTVPNTCPFVFAGVYGAWHGNATSARNSIGGYYFTHSNGPRGMNGWIAEVISYNRELSIDEIREVELYLKNKWIAPATVPAENAAVFAGDGDLTLTAVAAADGTVAPARWQGDLDMSCANIFVDGYERIKDGASRKVLVVDGEMTGSQFKSREPEGGPWRWVRRGNEWLLFYSTGSLFIFR